MVPDRCIVKRGRLEPDDGKITVWKTCLRPGSNSFSPLYEMCLTTLYKSWLPIQKERLGLNLRWLSTPKKEGFDKWPESNMTKKLGKDISWIDLPTDMKEPNDIRSNR
jgi:hypothetical protein